MGYCNYLEDKMLDHAFGGAPFSTPPETLLVGLCTGVDEDGVITGEPVGYSYARVEVDNDAVTWGAANEGTKANLIPIVFPEASGPWGTLTKAFLTDGSNTFAFGDLDPQKIPTSGDTITIETGKFKITLD